MGNRVYLEFRGSDLPILAEEDEEAIARLTCNNGLPLFWLTLIQEKDLSGFWEGEVRAVFAEPDEVTLEPIRLGWSEARANLAAARALAEARLPEVSPLLRAWETGLSALAEKGPVQEVRLYLAEHANFFDSAESFLNSLRRVVRIWHGAEQPDAPPLADPGYNLTGFDWLTDAPFPAALPAWQPGRPVPGYAADAGEVSKSGSVPGAAAEWGMAVVFAAICIGPAAIGARLLGAGGMWAGGVFGLVAAVAVVWRWAKWTTSR